MTRNFKIALFSALVTVLLPSIVKPQAQPDVSNFNKLVQILPPAPNAASLGKYGGINVGLSSGAANISIPIYDYSSNKIKLPISINYTSSGLKVGEIASRVGLNWALNAGGVITRTVFGAVDERSTRIFPPANFSNNRQMVTFMGNLAGSSPLNGGSSPYSSFDGQPDLFSFNFNGYTGQFILDTTSNIDGSFGGQPVLLAHSNLKIEKNYDSAILYSFKISTPDGVQYFFGSDDLTASFSSGSGCGYVYDNDIPTAWYLDKIVHPNNDTISFSYSRIQYEYPTSFSQTIYNVDPQKHSGVCPGNNVVYASIFDNSICMNTLRTKGALLEEINSTTGGRVKFNYISREDGNDRLLSSIELFKPSESSSFRVFNLSYEYPSTTSYISASNDPGLDKRPFLMSLVEKSTEGLLTKKYKFLYNDFKGLPSRLSFAQDHWGYFNGKNNNTFIPIPTSPYFKQMLPLATANREPDPLFCVKGLLASITYPTGGKDSIIYEGNQAFLRMEIAPQPTSISVTAISQYPSGITSYSDTANISVAQQVSVYGYCNSNDTLGAVISVIDANNNIVYNKTVQQNQSSSENVPLQPGSYRLRLTVYGFNASGGASLGYTPGNTSYQYRNENIGGARIAKVLTFDNVTGTTAVKKYIYSKLSNPDTSSGVAIYSPRYEKILKVYKPCSEIVPGACDEVVEFDYYTMYSNSISNLYVNTSLSATYASVVESFGENFENGGTEHRFTVNPDDNAIPYTGEEIMGVPMSSNSWANGREISQYSFKKRGSVYIPINKIFTHYMEDQRIVSNTSAYVANQKYIYSCSNIGEPTQAEWNAYDLMYYNYYQRWSYPDTIRRQTFDSSGNNYVETIEAYTYGNADHAQPTLVSIATSNGTKEIAYTSYPQDYTNTTGFIGEMKTNHLTGLPIEQVKSREVGSVLTVVSGTLTKYQTGGKGLVDEVQQLETTSPVALSTFKFSNRSTGVLPPAGTVTAFSPDSRYVPRLKYDSYDSKGNPLQVTAKATATINGPSTVYLWSYNKQYPVAEIKNADYATVASVLGGATAVENFSNQLPDSAQVRTFLAPLRTHASLKKASITTYTYDPLVGMTSKTDEKGEKVTYEYDTFQRLKAAKDLQGKIIETYDYHYKQP